MRETFTVVHGCTLHLEGDERTSSVLQHNFTCKLKSHILYTALKFRNIPLNDKRMEFLSVRTSLAGRDAATIAQNYVLLHISSFPLVTLLVPILQEYKTNDNFG